MKARVLTVLLVLSLFQILAQETFPSAELRQDFDFIVKTVQEVHPRPFANISEAELEQLQVQIQSQLEEPLTKQAFFDVVSLYVGSFQDDHTALVSDLLLRGDSSEPTVGQMPRRRAYVQVNNVGVLELPSFGITLDEQDAEGELQEFANFFKQSFEIFQNKDVTTLVIDLRNNPGGNSAVGNLLLAYVTDQPHRMFASVEVKISTQLIDWWERLGNEAPEDFSERIGETFSESSPLEAPNTTPLRFEGEVFVLTSQSTASAATDFAAVVKDFKLGTIVGEETGGLPTDFGDSILFTLPETGLELRVSSKYFVRPGNFDDGRGVLADCELEASEAMKAVLSGECRPIALN